IGNDSAREFVGKAEIAHISKGGEVLHQSAAGDAILQAKLGGQVADIGHRFHRILVRIDSHDHALATGRFHQAGEGTECGALAGTVRTEKPEDFALVDIEVYVSYTPVLSIGFSEINRLDRALHMTSLSVD